MRFLTFFIACQALFGFTGNWAGHVSGMPIAVEIDQDGGRLRILEVLTTGGGERLREFSVPFRGGTEFQVAGESWKIRPNGELTIRRAGRTFVLMPAETVQ